MVDEIKKILDFAIKELKDLRMNILLQIAKAYPDKEISELLRIYKELLKIMSVEIND